MCDSLEKFTPCCAFWARSLIMENSGQSDEGREELEALVARIKKRKCVLVLGPRIAIRPNDPDRRPLDELLACELLAKISAQASDPSHSSPSLRRASDSYMREKRDHDLLESAV